MAAKRHIYPTFGSILVFSSLLSSKAFSVLYKAVDTDTLHCKGAGGDIIRRPLVPR